MPWAAIDGFRQWTTKRKRLLKGLIGLAVEGVADCVPGGALAVWATRVVGEFAKHGAERLADASATVPDVKPAGQAVPAEQIEQLNGWLASLSTSYAGLIDRLDTLVTLRGDEPEAQLQTQIRQALSQHADLARDFDAHADETRRQTLSLARIEERLDEIYHGQKGIALSLEDIKAVLLQCAPPPGVWEQFRQARPEAVRLLVEADEHFLAGRREQGMNVLLRLFEQRGVGQGTLCRRLGGAALAAGNLKEASRCLRQVSDPDGRPPVAITRTLTSLTSSTTRGSQLPAWRSLPRGFVINRKYRVEVEVGRGGMASVYRCVGASQVRSGGVVAVKVPAPGLMTDAQTCHRFMEEIEVSLRVSASPNPAIVQTLGFEVFDDLHHGRESYGLVLEYIDGESLAQALALRQARGQALSVPQIQVIMKSVCAALEHAHRQSPPILHRDVKPPNVMVTRDGRIKLMDFGIARILEDRRQTVTGSVMGTWSYLPPEFLNPSYQPDVRSDVFLAANLLVELLTFHPQGDPERRSDCPKAWVELIGDAMNRVMSRRPASIREFHDRLSAALSSQTEETPPKPTGPTGPTADPVTDYSRWKQQIEELKTRSQRAADVFDYARAAAILETVPSNHRDEARLADWTRKGKQLKEAWERVESGWKDMSEDDLHDHLEEVLDLHPDHPRAKPWLAEVSKSARQQQRRRLHRGKIGDLIEVPLTETLRMKLAWVPPGKSWLGGGDGKPGTQEFTLAKGLWCGVYPVTQAEWQAVMGNNPSNFAGKPRQPVEQVSWDDVQEFIQKLNSRLADGGLTYRLPSEAEWEYICRGGPISQALSAYHFYFARSKTDLTAVPTNDLSSRQANFNGDYPAGSASKGPYLQATSEVGLYLPNPLGIYDLHGNVWEWTSTLEGASRLIRGGSWYRDAVYCTASHRRRHGPGYRGHDLGFRVLAVPSGAK